MLFAVLKTQAICFPNHAINQMSIVALRIHCVTVQGAKFVYNILISILIYKPAHLKVITIDPPCFILSHKIMHVMHSTVILFHTRSHIELEIFLLGLFPFSKKYLITKSILKSEPPNNGDQRIIWSIHWIITNKSPKQTFLCLQNYYCRLPMSMW